MENFTARTSRKDFGDVQDTADVDVEAQNSRNSTPGNDSNTRSTRPLVHQQDGDQDTNVTSTNLGSIRHSGTNASRTSVKSLRRRGRAETAVAYGAEEMGRSTGWAPGLEPGVDTSDPPPYEDAEQERHDIRHLEQLAQKCEITVVDYSSDQMSSQYLDNDNIKDFLSQPQDDWAQVRWINVNGLSWDVIRELGQYKNLHRLAIEDLMHTKNRTKADWYRDHTFVVLPLQKLVKIEDEEDSDEEDRDGQDLREVTTSNGHIHKVDTQVGNNYEASRQRHASEQRKRRPGPIKSLLSDVFKSKKKRRKSNPRKPDHKLNKSHSFNHASKRAPWAPKKVRTLQQWHAGPNQDRIAYMQRCSTLAARGYGVSVEQVSLFLTADNQVISFFEYSAQDVEVPIMRRLQSKSTILRQSCDASMLMQSILDTIIDLAIPVTTAYQDAIGDLELDVLTDPNIKESTQLYVLTSEIAILRGAIAPVNQLIASLREHKTTAAALTVPSRAMSPAPLSATQTRQLGETRPPMPYTRTERLEVESSGVTISELTRTYLGDVEDHAQIIQDSYDQMRRNADNLVDLIFNTVSAYQNEAMKQLTIVTAFFLPLTFMTGYFGMNFKDFDGVQKHSDAFFWTIASPVCAVVAIILLRDWIVRWLGSWAKKASIKRGRKRRMERAMM